MSIKAVHTINAFTATSGGTSTCTYDLLSALNTGQIVQAEVVVCQPKEPLMGQGEEWIIPVENDEKTTFGVSRNLRKALEQTNADIYHTNGLWRYCNHVTAVIARKKGTPFVITPHGMLYPQALERSKWQKRAMKWALFDRDIQEAACIHVTCEEEMQVVRALGYTNPIAVIGNPVRMPNELKGENVWKSGRGKNGEKVCFGYLGRLHPRKQTERIIEAMALLKQEERDACELVIMGTGEISYETFLRRQVAEKELNNVRFLGFVDSEEKQRQLATLSALFVPSDFENFGMIIAEALSCGTPVFASTGTPWKVLNEKGCGWWQEASPENIAKVMQEILATDTKKIDEMGRIGQLLIAECFSMKAVARQMEDLYKWIVTKQSKPTFVYE